MRILFAGGGTGGHINPALSIAKYVLSKRPDTAVAFVGTKEGIEADLVPKEGFKLYYIDVHGFKRKISLYNIGSLRRSVTSLFEAKKVISDFKPDAVVGTGGYVSGPVVFTAAKMGVKTLIHEQNVYPGATSKLLSKVADKTMVAFLDSQDYFPKKAKIALVGNPIRGDIVMADYERSRRELGIEAHTPFVISFAGSLGAREMNKTVISMFPKMLEERKFKFLHATGDRGWLWAPQMAAGLGLDPGDTGTVEMRKYIYDMPKVMAAADLVLSRAGAVTLSEIAAAKKPSILIPSPNVAKNHQEINARSFERMGAAKVILEKHLNSELLYDTICSLLRDKNKLHEMSENAQKLAIFDSCEKIYEQILKVL